MTTRSICPLPTRTTGSPASGSTCVRTFLTAILAFVIVAANSLWGAPSANASDTEDVAAAWAPFHNLGFSPDGRYYAFTTFGYYGQCEDEACENVETIAEVSVIDVARNSIARQAKGRALGNNAMERAEALAIQQVGTYNFGIRPWAVPGQVVYLADTTLSRARSPEGPMVFRWRNRSTSLRPGLLRSGVPIRLTLEPKPFPTTAPEAGCGMAGSGVRSGLRLSLTFEDGVQRAPIVLQDDARVPRSRGCALGYSIEQVIVHEGALVVIVAYETDPFEGVGESIGYIAITGAYPSPWTIRGR